MEFWPSLRGGVWVCLLFFINLSKIPNFFLAEMLLFLIVELMLWKNLFLVLLLAAKDSLAFLRQCQLLKNMIMNVTCHMPCVTCHVSDVTDNMSCVKYNFLLLLDKVVKLVGVGSNITGIPHLVLYSSSLLRQAC